jgi:hypothetical protein
LNGPPAQQDFITVGNKASYDDARIIIEDLSAFQTDPPLKIVIFRNFIHDIRAATVAAIIQERISLVAMFFRTMRIRHLILSG